MPDQPPSSGNSMPLGRPRIALAMEYPLMQQGGTEVLVRELARRLSDRFELVLVTGDKEAPSNEFAKLIAAHVPWERGHPTVAQATALAERLQRENVRVAHFHFGGTYEWSSNRLGRCPVYHLARRGVPCLSTNHLVVEWLNCGVHPDRSPAYKLLAQAYAWLSRAQVYRRLQLEVCVSRHDQLRLARMFPPFRGKITQRYHSLLSSNAPRPNLEGRAPLVLCVGTIGGRKAQPNLVEAFARIAPRYQEWQLDLVGRFGVAEDVKRIQESIARYGLAGRVHLSGWLPDEETVRRMQTASIIAMPSLQEGLGLSLQEALFHGCVGLGSRAGGIPELIEDEINGLLTPPGDISALSSALERLISDPGLLARLREQSRPSILRKGMTADAMAAGYEDLYRKLLGATNLGAPIKASS